MPARDSSSPEGIVERGTHLLFAGSVPENIRLARPSASDEEVRAAARALDINDVIEDLPQGFLTEIGEEGAGLSLGQRQVVAGRPRAS